ncbi:MAG: acyl-CoA/acyl-ACP dehydrogenase [Gammaproteobacteria bacterium]|nr:acyl-CoA/acyl-ACP dehydrogenase [Gammaproteobacteria bacterium]
MDFTFTKDQQLYHDSVKRFLTAKVTTEYIRQSWASHTGSSAKLWQGLVELGLTAMLVPKAYQGLGMKLLDFILLAQECGRVALPEPLLETTMVATPILGTLAEKDPRCRSLLHKIAAGEARIAVLHTVNNLISDAHNADWLLLPKSDQLHLLARDQVRLTAQASIDPSRRLFTVEWQGSSETCLTSGTEGVALLAFILNCGALATAAQLLGLAEAMLAMTVQYTIDRQQFGRPIGANQALKHHLANCAVATEFAKAPLYRAAYTVSQRPSQADLAISHAKVAAGEAAVLTAKHCIQAHGAMGYTWECDLHIFMKRAWTLDKFWGPAGFHKNRLRLWLMDTKAKIGADQTFSTQS